MMSLKIIAKNKRAYYDYSVQETYEAGLCLLGTETKSLRLGKAQINEAFIYIDDHGEAWVSNMNIPHYEFGNIHNHQETRKRKLLLHKKEIIEIKNRQLKENLTIVPLKIYFKKSLAKLQIGLAKGKKKYDKRESLKKRQDQKQMKKEG